MIKILRRQFLFLLFGLFVTGCLSQSKMPDCRSSRHALYDLGSGSTKLTLIETGTCETFPKVLLRVSEKVDYKDDLLKSDHSEFSPSIQEKGMQALSRLKAKAADLEAVSHQGVATAAFRESKNAAEFLGTIQKRLGISVDVISQEKEAQLAYRAARLYQRDASLLVWDVGGGSFQFTAFNKVTGEWSIFKGLLASVGFKDSVVRYVKKTPGVKSPNPMTTSEILQARALLREKLEPEFKKSFLTAKTFEKTVGLGGVLAISLKQHLGKAIFTVSDIENWISANHEKTDVELKDDYAATLVTNMILISEMMQMLNLKEVQALDVTLVEGLLN